VFLLLQIGFDIDVFCFASKVIWWKVPFPLWLEMD